MKAINSQNGVSAFKRLLSVSRRYWALLMLGMVATISVSSIDAGITWFLKPVIDTGFIDRNQVFIHWLPLIIICGFLLRSIFSFASSYCVNRVSRNVMLYFRTRLLAKYLKLPISVFDSANSGQFISTIIYNVNQVSQSSSEILLIMLREFTFMIGLLIVMMLVSWRLSLLFLIVTPAMVYIVRKSSSRIRRLSFGVQDIMSEITKAVDRSVRGCREIRLNGAAQKEASMFNHVANQVRHREMKMVVTNALNTSASLLLLGLPVSIILYIAINPNMHISAGAFASVLVSMITLQRPFKRLMSINATIQTGIAAAMSIFEVLDLPEEVDHGGQQFVGRAKGQILFENMSFQYPGARQWALKNIDFSIQPGMTVALVGRSGAGKSTLVSLLPRFFNPQKGVIKLDGHDINTYPLTELRAQFATVSQNVMLFDDTVANNICYGVSDRSVSEQEIEKAAELACAMGFIRELPDGLNTRIGQDGVLLSGGQQQRIAIARALLRDSPILIFDEATSALDSESEGVIQQALVNLFEKRTSIVIAHRLSTIQSADLIVVIDDGCIVEMGSHHQLIDADGTYAHLSHLQFKVVN